MGNVNKRKASWRQVLLRKLEQVVSDLASHRQRLDRVHGHVLGWSSVLHVAVLWGAMGVNSMSKP